MNRFRLIDVLTAVGCAALLLTLTIGVRQKTQEYNAIAECAVNLKRIGQALLQYQVVNQDAFPRTRYEPNQPVTAYTGATAANPFAADGPQANDVTAAAFLLAREMEVPADVFVCPAAKRHGMSQVDDFTPETVRSRSNFAARIAYNYALANMYAPERLDRYDLHRPADFAIAADTNPGGDGVQAATPDLSPQNMRMSNSPNHQRSGQNVLFAGGDVRFVPTPFVGVNKENIYASQGVFPMPANANDSVLLPHWSMGPNVVPATVKLRRWVFGSAMVLVTVGLVAFVYLNRRRPPAAS